MRRKYQNRSVARSLAMAVLASSAFLSLDDLEGARVETLEVGLRLEANAQSSASVDLPLPKPVTLDGVSLVHFDALLVTFVRMDQSLDSRATYNVWLLAEGVPLAALVSGTLTVNAGASADDWYTVERNAVASKRRAAADGIRISITADSPDMRTIASGLHESDVVRIHFVSGVGKALRTIPSVSEIVQQQAGDSPWAEYAFAEPVSVRNLAFLFHSRFGWGDPIGPSTAGSELILEDGSTLPLDDAYAPSLGRPRLRALSVTNSLLVDENLRDRFGEEPELKITAWRWRVQATGGMAAAMRPGDVQFTFLYDFPDCNSNGVPDVDERGTAADCNGNGLLDDCEPDCDGNGRPDECELRDVAGVDCNGNGILDVCDVRPLDPVLSENDGILFDAAIGGLDAADLDGDGDKDVIVAAGAVLSVLELREDGSLLKKSSLGIDSRASVVRAGTFIGADANVDVAVALGGAGIQLFAGDGALGLAAAGELDPGVSVDELFLSDIDGDSRDDLVLLPRSAVSVLVWMADPEADFTGEPITLSSEDGRRLHDVAVTDLRCDGTLDVVALDASGDELIVFPTNSLGVFDTVEHHAVGAVSVTDALVAASHHSHPRSTLAIVPANSVSPMLRLWNWEEAGLVESPGPAAEGRIADARAVDLDGDEVTDWIFALEELSTVEVVFGSGARSALAAGVGPKAVFILAEDSELARVAVLDAATRSVRVFHLSGHTAASADCNQNRIPDDCEPDVVCDPQLGTKALRADANDDGGIDISDALFILNWLFLGGPAPACPDAADANSDRRRDISDAAFVLAFLFTGGPPPSAAAPDCAGI
jgi:hypothetical protein